MTERLHIALVSTFYPNAAEPLRAVFIRNLAAALGRYAQLSIVSPVPYAPPVASVARWRSLRSIPRRVAEEGREVIHPRFLVIPKCAAATGFNYFAGTLRTLRELAKQQRIDVLHAHCAYPDAVGVALAAALLDIPFAVTAHGSDINVYAQRLSVRPQLKWALRRAGVVIAVSKAIQRRIEALIEQPSPRAAQPPPRIIHIPCAGVDSRVFAVRDQEAARRALALDPAGRVVVFAGQLVPIKAVQVLLQAWQILAGAGSLRASDRLVIAGDGPERAMLEARAAAGIDPQSVRFLGEISQQDLALWLDAASAFCLPSRNEGTPNVIIEAMACGRPVVASRVGGIPEIVTDGRNGFLVESGDAAQLAARLQAALEKRWDPQQIAAGVAEYTWDNLARRNIEALQGVLTVHRETASWAR